jgi:biotin carboxyl carrier protein
MTTQSESSSATPLSDTRESVSSKPAQAKPGMKQRWLIIILALTFLFVLMPFLFWQATWFGRPLDDAQIAKALADREQPREIQHALSQIADRILSANVATRDSARRFYPEVTQIAQTGGDELRLTAAWVMGQDNSVPEFHQALSQLLSDANPMVRRNAALSLVRFGDVAGRDEIRAILRPYAMPATKAGKLNERLRPGDAINPGTLLGHIESGQGNIELRSQVPGTVDRWLVPDGASVAAGQQILSVSSSTAEVWEALRALYLIGERQDLASVEKLAKPESGMPADLRQQAELAAKAIQSR